MTLTSSAIGEIQEIYRYPVKSFAGERLETCQIEPYGLYGDRFYAVIDETKEGWDSFVTARDIPNMLAYKARLTVEGYENEYPKVQVTSPDGRSFTWNEDLLHELLKYTKIKMSMMSCDPMRHHDLMAVDTASILIITNTTLRKLEAIWGKKLDKRRFRANFIVSLDDQSFTENDWIGKRLTVGSAELQVDTCCERCSMITLDPDTLKRDPSLLKKVHDEMDLNFGVYASVLKTGQVQVGAKVYVSD